MDFEISNELRNQKLIKSSKTLPGKKVSFNSMNMVVPGKGNTNKKI